MNLFSSTCHSSLTGIGESLREACMRVSKEGGAGRQDDMTMSSWAGFTLNRDIHFERGMIMKKLWVFIGILAIFFLAMSGNAFAKSEENKEECVKWCRINSPRCVKCYANTSCGGRDWEVIHSFKKGTGNWYACGLSEYGRESQKTKQECEAWCNTNKPRCVKCDSGATCGGRDLDIIKTFKEGADNWYACGLSEYAIESQKNKDSCEVYCKAKPDCVKCTKDKCGEGLKILQTFGGKGENWLACEKTKWAEHSEEAHADAIKWCADYKKETGDECHIVPSGQSCPNGFYKTEREKVTWGRDYKVCLKSKSDTQRVKDCSAKATANIEKALDWINTHYDTIMDFQMRPSDYRDRRAHARMDRKFPDVTVQCEDDRNKCKRSVRGWAVATGRYVNLCYDNHRTFCELVGTIIHEAGHTAWVDMKTSQHVGDPGAQNDTLYQFGYRAEDFCTGQNRHRTNVVPAGSKSYDYNL